MKIVILGAGQVGSTIAESLCADHDITVIDNDAKAINKLQNKFDLRAIWGHAVDPRILKEAGLETADMLIAVTSSDESNIIACQIALMMFGTKIKIARIRNSELQPFADLFDSQHKPIDLVINPAELVVRQLLEQIKHPMFSAIWSFAPDSQVKIVSISIAPLSPLNQESMDEIQERLSQANIKANLVGVSRDQKLYFPAEIVEIKSYDELVLCCEVNELNKVAKILLGNVNEDHKRIMIAGAGRIGRALAKNLESGSQVKLIEVSNQFSKKAANDLTDSLVLLGDATDADLLKQENIESMDIFCSVTNEDDNNIMSALLAKRMGAKHTIALVNQQLYAHYLSERSPDVDITISPQYITGSKLLRVLYKNTFENIYPIFYGVGYLLEITLSKDTSNIKAPKSYRLVAVLRGAELLFNFGKDFKFTLGDHLIYLVKGKKELGYFVNLDDATWV